MMNAKDLCDSFEGCYVEITWWDGRPESACGIMVGVDDEGYILLDWGYGVPMDAKNLIMKIVKGGPDSE